MNCPAHPSSRRGFTLVELLLGLALTAILLIGMGYSLRDSLHATDTNSHLIESRQEAQKAMEFMLGQIRLAKGIELYDKISGNEWGRLRLRLDDPDPDRNQRYVQFERLSTDTTRLQVSYLQKSPPSTQPVQTQGSDAALSFVSLLTFTPEYEWDTTIRQVTIRLDVQVPNSIAPNDPNKARKLSFNATEIARSITKP